MAPELRLQPLPVRLCMQSFLCLKPSITSIIKEPPSLSPYCEHAKQAPHAFIHQS